MRKLPVFKSVKEVLVGVRTHYVDMLIAAWPGLVILLVALVGYVITMLGIMPQLAAIELAQAHHDVEAVREKFAAIYSGWPLVQIVFCFILFVIGFGVAAVRWHRFVLLGERASAFSVSINPLRREDGAYIWTSIKIMLLMSVLMASIAIILGLSGWLFASLGLIVIGEDGVIYSGSWFLAIAFLVTYSAMLIVAQRLMLASPDAAIGRGGRVITIFRETHGNSLRLLGAFLLLGFAIILGMLALGIVFALSAVLLHAIGLSLDDLQSSYVLAIVVGLIDVAIYLFFLMLPVTLLSVAYREIIGLPGDSAPEPEIENLRIEPA